MTNIFRNAFFGKPYKTRDGRKAIYIEYNKALNLSEYHYLLVENSPVILAYNDDGTFTNDINEGLHITSEWQESIDEEELDKLAKEYAQKNLGYSDIQMRDFDSWHTVAQAKFREVCEDFKAGFRKSLKQ